jgi:indoleacetamide hydrolase
MTTKNVPGTATGVNATRRSLLKATGVAATLPVLSACSSASSALAGPAIGTPAVDAQLAFTATEAVQAIANGSMSAEAYISTLLARADKLASLNSMISLNREGALAAAKKIDSDRRAGAKLGALAGLPIVVKDNIDAVGLATTGGTAALKNLKPATNAPTLQKLIDAGAIVLGKANMHELALGATSTNFTPFASIVKNPYDTTRIPGGSSGGTAAAIGARISPAGLGSDTGASVRVPAAFTGIAGLRPSVGNGGAERRYSTSGVLPLSHTLDTVGPMARTVADVALLDAVMTDSTVPAAVPLAGLRFGVPAILWQDLDKDVAAVLQKARAKLAAAGVVLVDIDMPGIVDLGGKSSLPIALHEPRTDMVAYLKAHGASGITLENIAAQIASPDVKAAFQSIVLDDQAANYARAINEYRPQLQQIFASYFKDNNIDAILFPTAPVPAPVIDPVNGSSTVSINGGPPVNEFATIIRNMVPDSVAGIPSLSLPAGMTPGGLPVGIEIDGPLGSDRRLLGIGMTMEQLLGPVPAPSI